MPIYYKPKAAFDTVPSGEIKKYLAAASGDFDFSMALIMAWLTGARIIEVTRIKRENITIDGDYVQFTIKAVKHGGYGYPTFSIKDTFVAGLVDFIAQKSSEEYILLRGKNTYQKRLHALNQLIYPDNKKRWLTFHYLRHSRITWLARAGASAIEIKSWTGHRSSAYEEYFAAARVRRFAGKIK